MRSQFTFYASFLESVSRIRNKAARCDAYDAIVRYALTGEEPDLDKLPDVAAICFVAARPNIDASRRKAEGGKNGGSRKDNESIPEAYSKDSESIPEAYSKREETASEKEGEDEKEKEGEKENECYIPPVAPPLAKRPRFVPPTFEEVEDYCFERENGIDAQHFLDYYEANGWKVGKNPMKDWKAAVRNWERMNKNAPRESSGTSFADLYREMQERGIE